MKQKYNAKTFAIDVLYDIVGNVIFSIGLSSFAAPKEIAPGGVSGIAVIVNDLTGVPLGTITMCINIPLILLAWKFLGREFTLKTLKSVFFMSVILNYVAPLIPVYGGDYILSALLGGVLIGTGLAIVFMRGSTTGGTDILSRLIQLKFRGVPIGKAMMTVDAVILCASVVVFQNIEAGLYGLICIFTSARTLDSILFGLNTGKVVMIISAKEQEISKAIIDQMERGVTFLKSEGAYSRQPRDMILCAIRAQEYHKLNEIVRAADPNAFVIVAEASEILGEGFRYITEDKVT